MNLEYTDMATTARRNTSLRLNVDTLDQARKLGINISAVAEEALAREVAKMNRDKWLEENAEAFKAQHEWHERNGHPLKDIMTSPVGSTWKS